MKNIPMRPKMTKEELEQVQEQFMRGESIIKSPENKPIKTNFPKVDNLLKSSLCQIFGSIILFLATLFYLLYIFTFR